MNNEETILDPQSFASSNTTNSNASSNNKSESNAPVKKETKPAKSNNTAEKVAYAAGGFVAGAASMAAGDVFAAAKKEEEVKPEEVVEEQPQIDPADSPSEHEAIIASDEGLRVAQVDDDQSFDEAFADARAQVGPGGVFEWHGKVYGTFYKYEWEQMSPEERAEWQSKVDYDDLRDEDEAQQYSHHNDVSHQHTVQDQSISQNTNVHQTTQPEESEPVVEIVDIRQGDVDGDGEIDTVVELDNGVMFADTTHDGEADLAARDVNGDGIIDNNEVIDVSAEHIVLPGASTGVTYTNQQSSGANDVDVHVIEVGQADLNGDGMAENVALVEIDGNEVMLVDINDDYVADFMIADMNSNEQVDGNEIVDITSEGVGMPTMSDGDLYMAQNDMEPDYTNDADMGLYEA